MFSETIRYDISFESSARQMIRMKYYAFYSMFSPEENTAVFQIAVCCSCVWFCNGYSLFWIVSLRKKSVLKQIKKSVLNQNIRERSWF